MNEVTSAVRSAHRRAGIGGLMLVAIVAGLFGSDAAHAAKAAKHKNDYGAVAYHVKTGTWGISYDQKSSREAIAAATAQCGAGCGEAKFFRNACGAVAASTELPPRRHALNVGKSRELAEAGAVERCGRGCVVLAWACTK